jgi:hypothetical protein
MIKIATSLLAIQKEIGKAVKDKKNDELGTKYADLDSIQDACLKLLNDKGIVCLQPNTVIEGKNYVKTLLIHAESGETMEGVTEIIFVPGNAQSQGSGITYARRNGLKSLLNLREEDDDGNAAVNPEEKKDADIRLKKLTQRLRRDCKTVAQVDDLQVKNSGYPAELFDKRKKEIQNNTNVTPKALA